ncbi:triacylglycerol lipase 3 [Trichomonascus vanleenenianus]|uniref:bifunctional triglyceride lipase/lysophosphatidylethanolamine acyltransferase n=1 Tax=Trichomonascus vanleenenianus TaxID=2268995 RepID=UPI003EC9C3CB
MSYYGSFGAPFNLAFWIVYLKDTILFLFRSWAEMISDVFEFWKNRVWCYMTESDEKSILKAQLQLCESYSEWQDLSYKLDSVMGNDIWRQNPVSRKYDYKLISKRLKELATAREESDLETLLEKLRSGLLRNLGSIATTQLYNRAYGGTKLLIEDYINEVIGCLEYMDKVKPNSNVMLTSQRQLDFFHDTRQSFGNSALILHGGSLFGLCHLGVLKALYDQGLMPRILSGSTVGALVASLACTCEDDEFLPTIESLAKGLPELDDEYSDMKYQSVAEGILTSMCPPEIFIFERFVRERLGNMTFEEAYLKTDRVLNINVAPKKTKQGFESCIPTLLNYLTAPNVVIWSAAQASIGTGVLQRKVDLLVKDRDGNIKPFLSEHSIDFTPANQHTHVSERESPYTRLSELFNVNCFIVSLARPYFAPLLLSDFKHRGYQTWYLRLIKLLRLEFQHRLAQSTQLHILPTMIQQWFVDENIPNGFQVTIVPELPSLLRDVGRVFDSHHIKYKVDHWIRIGEKSTWPMLSIIWARCAIEFVLDDIYNRKRSAITSYSN